MENNSVRLIGIIGNTQSGKDTVGMIIQYLVWKSINPNYTKEFTPVDRCGGDWEIKKFANKLKQISSILLGVPAKEFESIEFKNSLLPIEWQEELESDGVTKNYTERTYRWFLQHLGTEAIRDTINKNCWVNALFADYDVHMEPKYYWGEDHIPMLSKWIITDVRFNNEVDAIKSRGGILIRKHGITSNTDIHQSESELSNYIADFDIEYCDNINDLIENVRIILEKIGII